MRRHRLLFAGLTLLPLFATVQAQSTVVPPKRFGLTAGVNASTIAADDGDPSRLMGFVGGAFLVLPITPTISIQPELLYSMKGVKTEAENITVTGRINYVEIPVLGRYDVPAPGNAKPVLYAGPAIAFNVSCRATAEGNGISLESSCEDESTGEGGPKTLDFSAVVGAGITFKLVGRTFTVGARYTYGLTNVADEGTAKNRTISVLGSIEFPWPK